MRTLGLATVVRKFNDLAVPGMGGVWFGKQLLVANLGVALAERARMGGRQFRNIEVANAVEALACWLALEENGWQSDPRLFGRLKMQGKNDLAFRKVRQPGFYVTQPMRMRTVQPLLALGLVDAPSERFNAFQCTETGRTFIEAACHNYRPKNRSVLQNLLCWMQNDDDCIKTYHSRQALSPVEPLTKEAREILRERIVRGSDSTGGRRRNLLDWMDELRKTPRHRSHGVDSRLPSKMTTGGTSGSEPIFSSRATQLLRCWTVLKCIWGTKSSSGYHCATAFLVR
jgi:hypothetical protein